MASKFFNFPSADDWNQIYDDSELEKIHKHLDISQRTQDCDEKSFVDHVEINVLCHELIRRFYHMERSYIFSRFYYENGIPDDEWHLSPGTNGESVEYYPHFTKDDHLNKSWFDFYVDVFYFKIFSMYDVLAHIVNVAFILGFQKRNTSMNQNLISKLKGIDAPLSSSLSALLDSPEFIRAKEIRNDISHNYLPHSVGMSVTRNGGTITVGIKSYIKSREIIKNMNEIQSILCEMIKAIFEKTYLVS